MAACSEPVGDEVQTQQPPPAGVAAQRSPTPMALAPVLEVSRPASPASEAAAGEEEEEEAGPSGRVRPPLLTTLRACTWLPAATHCSEEQRWQRCFDAPGPGWPRPSPEPPPSSFRSTHKRQTAATALLSCPWLLAAGPW